MLWKIILFFTESCKHLFLVYITLSFELHIMTRKFDHRYTERETDQMYSF